PPPRAERVAWLQAHTSPIRSIDPDDLDFSDLAVIGDAIGNARMVLLGEQSHGDGSTFLAKTRLIRFLHERLGFDVLAFESGLYDMRKVWQRLRAGEAAFSAVRRGLFGIWSLSEQVQPLVHYLAHCAHSASPLEVTGFDCQPSGSACREFL